MKDFSIFFFILLTFYPALEEYENKLKVEALIKSGSFKDSAYQDDQVGSYY
jgi:hypothetical protein